MPRCCAKALLIEDGNILVNQYRTQAGEVYYDLPGGGQQHYEPIEQTIVREVLEETGYSVSVEAFSGFGEEICTDENRRQRFPEYCHRSVHLFRVKLTGNVRARPSEPDWEQTATLWVALEEAEALPFRFSALRGNLKKLIEEGPVYLGTVVIG